MRSPPPVARGRRRGRARAGPLRWALRILAGLGAVLGLLVLLLAGILRGSVPPAEESVALDGLEAPVSITLDGAGIPRIAARSERDAAMALGYLHARDRMFQMELMRRGAAGRLAEVAGPAALRADRFVRTLGLAARAEADLAALPPATRDLLEAYAAGVNGWIAARGRFAAPEFIPLGAPEPWRPEHSLYWAKVMGLWLSGDWRAELSRARLLAAGLPEARIAELWPADDSPGRPGEALPAEPRRAAGGDLPGAGPLDRLAAALPRFPADPGSLPASASNAWAVAGRRSASGAPLLAADPHLGFQAPVLWYLVRIDLPEGRMRAGATSPGVPLVVIGRNELVAWGFTTTHSDTQDLVVERLAGAAAYETPDGPRPFATRVETIRIRGRSEPERLVVRETRHGPVLSDLDGIAAPAEGSVLAVAMANLQAAPDSSAEGLLALNRARSLAEVRAAAALIASPPQNLMAADADGRIGLYLTGRTPRRRGGADGFLPMRGWEPDAGWDGFLPFDALPHVEAPPSGVLVNANNRVAPPEGPPLGRHWPGDWRFRRIGALLAAEPVHDAPGFAAMQMDEVSLLARELLGPGSLLRGMAPPVGVAGAALELLLAWDGRVAPESPAPLIFAAWREAMLALAMAQAGVPEGAAPAGSGSEFLRVLLHPDGRGAWWCGGDCPGMARRALERAVAGIAAAQGETPSRWRWGAVHVARFEHPVLRFVPVIGDLLRLEAVTGGDGETINRGGYRGEGPPGSARFAHVHGPGLRLVADLADPDATLAMIATGQSGHPLSRHWGDLLEPWRRGETVRLGRLPETTAGRILLVP